MANEQNLLAYWRQSLADAERMNVDPKRLQDAVRTARVDVACGRLDDLTAEAIVEAHRRAERRPNKSNKARDGADGEREVEEIRIPVLICPALARPKRQHAYYFAGTEKPLTPLWLPAVMLADGRLVPPTDSLPWVTRNLLEPIPGDYPTIGTVEALDHFLTFNPFPVNEEDKEQPPRWDDLWFYCQRMMEAVTGGPVEAFGYEGYETEQNAYLLVDSPIQGAAKHVIRLYDIIRRECVKGGAKLPGLLRRFISLRDEALIPLLTAEENVGQSQKHYGQMNARHALSASQREAMHHILRMKDGEILAVNGPPGTGKTTLLQSVVATMWVEAAMRQGEPPVIVAASTNNQAVRNVIDSFGKVEENNSPLAGRWLPQLTSYGLYCPASSRLQEKETAKVQVTLPKGGFLSPHDPGSGERTDLEGEEFIAAARDHFLVRCEVYARQKFRGVQDATAFLHALLVATVTAMTEGLRAWQNLDELEKRAASEYGKYGGLDAYIEKGPELLDAARRRTQRAKELRDGWLRHVDGYSLLWTLLAFLPPVRRRIGVRNRLYLSSLEQTIEIDPADTDAVTAHFGIVVAESEAEERRVGEALRRASELKQTLDEARSRWERWTEAYGLDLEPPELLEEIDRKFRFEAFKLATHYWEGRWLLEMQAQFDGRYRESKSERKQRKRWRRYAKLTPCFVSTLYMLPDYFLTFESRDATNELRDTPLFEFIDLLIIDEAGQVAPDVAGASFSLAKRGLVVGDVMQLEPVWGVTRPVDLGNMREGGLVDSKEEEQTIHEKGLSASKGNVMKVAQRASRYQKSDERGDYERGMFLAEHRRCLDEIIEFCNELAYKGRLVPLCDRRPRKELPPVGFAHVEGRSRSEGSSRVNPQEAQAIAGWIAEHRQLLKSLDRDRPLDETVAVVTPFNRQAALLRRELKRKGLEGVTVGTVHVLQGAERRVVIFSPVYGPGEVGQMMFDRSVNMLNVAVSRAMDSFLVFGNTNVFNPKDTHLPSGLLARHLFAKDTNRITYPGGGLSK